MCFRLTVKRVCQPLLIVGALCAMPQVSSAEQNSSWWATTSPIKKMFSSFSRDAGISNGAKVAEAAVARPSQGTGPAGLVPRYPAVKQGGAASPGEPRKKKHKVIHGKNIKDIFTPHQSFAPISGKYGGNRVNKGYRKAVKVAVSKSIGVERARSLWSRLIPSTASGTPAQVQYVSSSYSLKLDPTSYAILPTQTGGNILVDGRKKLPPLVKSLLMEKYPDLVVVSESPANPKQFYRSLLEAGQFFSTEEDFLVSFGTDPKITVKADFKIEKDADSLLKQEVVLLNVAEGRRRFPAGICKLLSDNGFQLIEGSSVAEGKPPVGVNLLHEITSQDPRKILDGVLDAMSLSHVKKDVALFVGEDVGLQLEVPVDRFFSYDGKYYVALQPNDSNTETLVNLLEAQGHRVIVLQEGDDLRSISDKLFLSMNLKPEFGGHDLWSSQDKGYGVNISGVMFRDQNNGKKVFLTDRKISPQVEEMVNMNGYRLLVSK